MSDKVYLIDGSGYVFRAYYAVAPLTTAEGFPTNALFGFSRMVIKLLNTVEGDHVVMVFDAGRETFRNELYSEYKANRDECPEDLAEQMPYFREISRALGMPLLELPGYEADDLIGTLATRLSAAGVETVVVSGDKDLMQLVGGTVTMWDSMKDRHYGPTEVQEKMGVPPEKVVDLLGLMGDSSDNVPGLAGVGPKTAVQLIEKYEDIETILKSAEAIREDKGIRNRKKISDQIELDSDLVRLSKKLVQVECAVPLEIELGDTLQPLTEIGDTELIEALRCADPDQEQLNNLVNRFEFHSLFKDFGLEKSSEESSSDKFNYQVVYAEDFDNWFKKFSEVKEFSFDLETTSLDPLAAEIVGIAFCWDNEEAWYVPVGHKSGDKEQIDIATVFEKCTPIFEDPKIKKCGQNLKFDVSVLARYGLEVEGVDFDSMIASYLLNPDKRGHSLGALAQEVLGRKASEYSEIVGDLDDFSHVPIAAATNYACEDAHFAWLLKEKFVKKISEQNLDRVLREVELPLVTVLSRMEMLGIRLDSAFLQEMSEELDGKVKELEEQIFEEAGCEFNLNSPKQLADVLFNRLGIPTTGVKKTKTGFSTDSSVLEKLSLEYALPDAILEYRGLHKLKSTYVDALPEQVSPLTNRLHTKFNQTITATGRLSSSDPNLQNIPIQSEEGRKVRQAFIPSEGCKLVSADYSQIELRLLAHMSGDANLIAAFNEEVDIHAQTAREILGIGAGEEVDSDSRRIGKTINFGIIYGMSGFRLGRELGIPVGVANQYIEDYFDHYSGVQELFDELEQQATKDGFVTTLWGRKRVIQEVDASGRDKGFLRRVAINAPIQGSAADIVKVAMIDIDRELRTTALQSQMLLQIHDELVFEAEDDACEGLVDLVKCKMEGVIDLKVPLVVDIGIGSNWDEAH